MSAPAAGPAGPYGLTAEHEALCRRCGLSCHFGLPVNGLAVAIPGLRCRFLIEDGPGHFACTVYADRFARAPWCRSVAVALEEGLLAQDCPYARGRAGYRGKVWLHRRLLAQVLPAVRRHLLQVGLPESVDVPLAVAFMNRADPSVTPVSVVFDAAARRYWFVVAEGAREPAAADAEPAPDEAR